MYTLMLGQTWPQEVMVSKFSIFRGFNYVVQFWWMNLGILNFLERKKIAFYTLVVEHFDTFIYSLHYYHSYYYWSTRNTFLHSCRGTFRHFCLGTDRHFSSVTVLHCSFGSFLQTWHLIVLSHASVLVSWCHKSK